MKAFFSMERKSIYKVNNIVLDEECPCWSKKSTLFRREWTKYGIIEYMISWFYYYFYDYAHDR